MCVQFEQRCILGLVMKTVICEVPRTDKSIAWSLMLAGSVVLFCFSWKKVNFLSQPKKHFLWHTSTSAHTQEVALAMNGSMAANLRGWVKWCTYCVLELKMDGQWTLTTLDGLAFWKNSWEQSIGPLTLEREKHNMTPLKLCLFVVIL